MPKKRRRVEDAEKKTPKNKDAEKNARNEKTAALEKDEKLVWLAGRSPFWNHFNGHPVMTGSSGPPKTPANSPIRQKRRPKKKDAGKKTPEKNDAEKKTAVFFIGHRLFCG